MIAIFFSRPAPKNEEEMMVLIFEYIDRLFSVVRPRRLLYMAIDGVVGWNDGSFVLNDKSQAFHFKKELEGYQQKFNN